MKIKRILSGVLMLILVSAFLAGCGDDELSYLDDADYVIYLTDESYDKLIPVPYNTETSDEDTLINELYNELRKNEPDYEAFSTVTEDIYPLSCRHSLGGILCIDMSSGYRNLDKFQEIITRASIVRTLTQIPDVRGIVFSVEGEPLTDSDGTLVGTVTSDAFVENPGKEINNIQQQTLTLYFPSEDGTSLVKESQELYFSGNVSLEKKVVERLMEGPVSGYGKKGIPEECSLINVLVMDGICIVNFDNGFLNYDVSIEDPVVIYSIVNSLTEVTGIEKVQISVNGVTNIKYNNTMSLEEYYTMDLSFVNQDAGSVEVEEPDNAGVLQNILEKRMD